jgi:hypothetical protein
MLREYLVRMGGHALRNAVDAVLRRADIYESALLVLELLVG